MSIDEMRLFCKSIRPYELRVNVRLRDGRRVIEGKITGVGTDYFQVQTDDTETEDLRYAWVAGIKRA